MTGPALLGNDVGQALHLVLGAAEGADATLDELAGTLVLGVSDELHGATLVGGEAGDLADDGADHLDTLALATLAVGGTRSKDTTLGGVASVDAPDETCGDEGEEENDQYRVDEARWKGELGKTGSSVAAAVMAADKCESR